MLCSSLHIAEVSPAPVVVHFRGIPRKRHQSPCALAMYNQHPTSGRRGINRAHRATYPFIIALQDDCKQHVAKDFRTSQWTSRTSQRGRASSSIHLAGAAPTTYMALEMGVNSPPQKGSITRTICWLRELSFI